MRRALLLAGLIGACEPRAEPPARAQIRDSAGVTIVENLAPLARDSVANRDDVERVRLYHLEPSPQ